MRANRLFQGKGPLKFCSAAFVACELAAERSEFLPTRLFVANRTITIRTVLKVAAEILDLALYQTGVANGGD